MSIKINMMKTLIAVFALVFTVASSAQEDSKSPDTASANLNSILQKIIASEKVESKQAKQREQRFIRKNSNKVTLLANLKKELERQNAIGVRLKNDSITNEQAIDELNKKLKTELGNLEELFGHLTGAAGDLREDLDSSIISAQYPNRSVFVTKLVDDIANPSKLPSISDIRRVWLEMVRQMVESSKVVTFNGKVVKSNGEIEQRDVLRVGNYNLMSSGNYLTYIQETGKMQELARQPNGLGQVKKLQASSGGFTKVGIDPTGPYGGVFLSAIVRTPGQIEQWHQGGYVGYIITVLGVFAVLLAIWRWIVLGLMSRRVGKQLQNVEDPSETNPLGRILHVYKESSNLDVESLELKINEAIIKERPAIDAWLNAIKIIASLSPLLGLLGTVTGMILTFQGIMIHGAGDVAGMADGISQALQTTKLGLFAAVPAVLMHTIVSSRASHIIQVLEEQASGIVASQAEKQS